MLERCPAHFPHHFYFLFWLSQLLPRKIEISFSKGISSEGYCRPIASLLCILKILNTRVNLFNSHRCHLLRTMFGND